MELSPRIIYPVFKASKTDGKKAVVIVREKDLYPESKSMSQLKFFFDELPEGITDGCRMAFTGVKANFSVVNKKRKYEPEDGKVFWIDDMCVNGASVSVVAG